MAIGILGLPILVTPKRQQKQHAGLSITLRTLSYLWLYQGAHRNVPWLYLLN